MLERDIIVIIGRWSRWFCRSFDSLDVLKAEQFHVVFLANNLRETNVNDIAGNRSLVIEYPAEYSGRKKTYFPGWTGTDCLLFLSNFVPPRASTSTRSLSSPRAVFTVRRDKNLNTNWSPTLSNRKRSPLCLVSCFLFRIASKLIVIDLFLYGMHVRWHRRLGAVFCRLWKLPKQVC